MHAHAGLAATSRQAERLRDRDYMTEGRKQQRALRAALIRLGLLLTSPRRRAKVDPEPLELPGVPLSELIVKERDRE